jgi:hypothetical protein
MLPTALLSKKNLTSRLALPQKPEMLRPVLASSKM